MVKLMALLAVAVVVGSAAAQVNQGAKESQGKGKKFGLDNKGVNLLSNRLIYGQMVSTCQSKDEGNTLALDPNTITSVDNAKKCGFAVGFSLFDGVPFAMNEDAANFMPAEPVCVAGDNNATKIKKLKVLRAHRVLRTVLVYCANDLREVCGFGPQGDADLTCTEQVLNLCPDILDTTPVPTLIPSELCRCQKANPNIAGCFKDNQGLGNRRLLFNLGGGKKPDSDVGSKGELGGAIRSIKNCFGNNTVSQRCTSAINVLSRVSIFENGELEVLSKQNQAVGRRQLQLSSDELKVLSDAADELDPPAAPASASGLGAPLALALAVLALNR
jgi:hypothetical protein